MAILEHDLDVDILHVLFVFTHIEHYRARGKVPYTSLA